MSILKKSGPLKSPSNEPTTSASVPVRHESPAVKIEAPMKDISDRPGSSYPPVKTSTVDVDAKPIHQPTNKSITDVDMDAGN